ncbi:hypothetical protein B9J78_05140 [bacterium Unc6]|nr:hypothetical protein [bacterium Unc6]
MSIIKIKDLPKKDVPIPFRAETYFDFKAHPFVHKDIFKKAGSVVSVLDVIGDYILKWLQNRTKDRKNYVERPLLLTSPISGKLKVISDGDVVFKPLSVFSFPVNDFAEPDPIFVSKGSVVFGTNLFVSEGGLFIGKDTTVEPCSTIKGPVIIGDRCQIRGNAYIRGPVIIGNDVIVGGEIKNSILMDGAKFPHISYLGDSICGYKSHFGNQATSANFGIFSSTGQKKNVIIEYEGEKYDLGRRKIGVVLGDFSQVGCSCVTSPGTFIGKNTVVYPLALLPKGFYPSESIIKYKPNEHIEIVERL